MTYRNNKLRQSAQGELCTMFGPTCSGGGEERNDVCLRHSNRLIDGKGTGIKANDDRAFYGCQPCEDWYSRLVDLPHHETRDEACEKAIARTHERALELGVMQ